MTRGAIALGYIKSRAGAKLQNSTTNDQLKFKNCSD